MSDDLKKIYPQKFMVSATRKHGKTQEMLEAVTRMYNDEKVAHRATELLLRQAREEIKTLNAVMSDMAAEKLPPGYQQLVAFPQRIKEILDRANCPCGSPGRLVVKHSSTCMLAEMRRLMIPSEALSIESAAVEEARQNYYCQHRFVGLEMAYQYRIDIMDLPPDLDDNCVVCTHCTEVRTARDVIVRVGKGRGAGRPTFRRET